MRAHLSHSHVLFNISHGDFCCPLRTPRPTDVSKMSAVEPNLFLCTQKLMTGQPTPPRKKGFHRVFLRETVCFFHRGFVGGGISLSLSALYKDSVGRNSAANQLLFYLYIYIYWIGKSSQIIIFHQPGFSRNKGIYLPESLKHIFV